ncbi:MAG: hypothetical protein F6K40_11120 [Okeania sp. SIO3I5]|uniref:hypothetical protein n=1 Tax=Okeania sp. SIO3I5 TaxID=2607805 RepID=UPI0013BCCCD3|nr:hypothetical protein [Okeania sp. SIO3I5]NEQ36798.1 hypothetical protein [Okeania sp. SIO3I5]
MFDRNKLTRSQIEVPQMSLLANMEVEGQIIADIKYDELYYAIQKIASSEPVCTMLEIGSFTGQGSTEAFVTGMLKNPHEPHLFCIEAVDTLFAELAKRYQDYSQVHCYHGSTVTAEQFPSSAEVMAFYKSHLQVMQEVSLDTLMQWLQEDRIYIETSGIATHIISTIQQEHKIARFDVVLIDGSEFTGLIELEQVYGANIIILDDINVFKNYHSYHRLMEDPGYVRTSHNPSLRNGYAIFHRLGYLEPDSSR